MFFYQGAKQNKGLKALVTRENVRKLMLDVNVVIFSNICHSISSLEAEAFWTVSVWMIFFVKWSRKILNEFSEDTGNHRRFYSQSGSGSLTTWEWPIFFKSNNKDGNVTCSPERPIKGSICSDPYIYIYNIYLYIARHCCHYVRDQFGDASTAFGSRNTDPVSAAAVESLLFHFVAHVAFGSSLWLDSRFAAKGLCFFQRGTSPYLLAF